LGAGSQTVLDKYFTIACNIIAVSINDAGLMLYRSVVCQSVCPSVCQ